MAARVAAIRRFLADSRQELHEVHRSQTPEGSRRNLPLLGHRVGRYRAAGNAWKVRHLKSLSRRWAKSAIANQSRLTAYVQIERPGLEGTSVTSSGVSNRPLQRQPTVAERPPRPPAPDPPATSHLALYTASAIQFLHTSLLDFSALCAATSARAYQSEVSGGCS